MSAIQIKDVSIRYGSRTLFQKLSIEVAEGTVYALLGRNGVGKSSLIRCLLGLQRPTTGHLAIMGDPVWQGRARIMAKVGVVPEDPHSPPDLKVHHLMSFHRRVHSRWDEAAVRTRLEQFAIPMDVAFGRLSKGQKKLVELSLALGHSPRLLVLDDPTQGLDAVARRILFEELINELAEGGTTVLLTTHDLTGVESIAQRVGILAPGRLLVDEPLEALKSRFRRLAFRNGDANAWKALKPLSVTQHPWGTEAVVDGFEDDLALPEPSEVLPMSLEEIFTTLVESTEGGVS